MSTNLAASNQILAKHAATVRAEIQKCHKAACLTLDAAMNAGDALRAVRPHVDAAGLPWQRWLKDNCFIGKSTALLYVQLAEHRADIEAEIDRGVDLSLRAARRLIAAPRANSTTTDNKSAGTGAEEPPEDNPPDLGADLHTGTRYLVAPTVLQSAWLARVNVTYVHHALKQAGNRFWIENGHMPLVPPAGIQIVGDGPFAK